jgi:hypothetical protein
VLTFPHQSEREDVNGEEEAEGAGGKPFGPAEEIITA